MTKPTRLLLLTPTRCLAVWTLLAVILSCVLSGCLAKDRRTQLDRVAKDWCETIRAAQVIPVFPLREDLQPGDVFLVCRSLAEQRKDFAEGGPLALDDQRTRLGKSPTIDYSLMYFNGYFKDEFGVIPHERVARAPGDATSFITRMPAPAAAFPTYTFEVKRGSSANLAIPISGVPVALGFMQTGNATGSVQLQDAYTYSADTGELYRFVSRWAEDGRIRLALNDAVHNNGGQPVHLRVVTRVFLVGGVVVSLFNQETGGASGSAGQIPSIPIFDTAGGKLSENYSKLLDLLSKQASGTPTPPSTQPATQPATAPASTTDTSSGSTTHGAAPAPTTDAPTTTAPEAAPAAPVVGGNVKFTWANQRTVSMDERFARPLVVGYHAFDVPVYSGGVLGQPLATWAVLKGQLAAATMPVSELSPAQQLAFADLDRLTKPSLAPDVIRAAMIQIIHTLGYSPENPGYYEDAMNKIKVSTDAPDDDSAFVAAKLAFEDATNNYLGDDTTYTVRPTAFHDAFVHALSAPAQP
jgi:hypothetical protein